jgi:hypothetical protein
MNRVGKIAIWLAGGLVLSAGARADNVAVALAGNPYKPIVTRNVFGLNPVQAEEAPGEPPPKITLNGIMSIRGKSQALYKVAGTGKAGKPDTSYMLSEGQRQDDVEVTHIDDKAGLVTFNNHGIVQDIPLANAPTVTTSGPGSGGASGASVSRPAFSRSTGGFSGGNGENGAGTRAGRGAAAKQNRWSGNSVDQNPDLPLAGMGGGMSVGGLQTVPTRAGQKQPVKALTPDEQAAQAAAILLNTTKLKSDGNPAWQIMPPVPGVPLDQ